MVKMRKSETILSIKKKEKKIYTIKPGKGIRRIGGMLANPKNRDVAGDDIDTNQLKEVIIDKMKRKKNCLQDRPSCVTIPKKGGKQYIERKRGLIYITHLPQDYTEKKVKQYFKNIGKITNVRVYKSKIYDDVEKFGYVEFEHPEIAKIAVEKINNDYAFTENIKAEYISYEKQPKDLFKLTSNNKKLQKDMNKSKVLLFTKSKTADNAKVKRKAIWRNVKSRQHLAVQCNLIPVDLCDQIIKEIKQETESQAKLMSGGNNIFSKEQIFTLGKSSTEQFRSKNTLRPLSKKSINKSLADIKSNRAILSKSLDSVKNVLEKNSSNSQDEETQTPKQAEVKKERNNNYKKINFRGRILRNKLTLNSITIKRIARELIRKRGYPLISLKCSQKDSMKYKK